jgi:hypothetical protein
MTLKPKNLTHLLKYTLRLFSTLTDASVRPFIVYKMTLKHVIQLHMIQNMLVTQLSHFCMYKLSKPGLRG